ncbi:MAG TPA: YceI family protein [Chthoniobacterales bacterium]|jgi:polyisoprenoid-binding protein YceI
MKAFTLPVALISALVLSANAAETFKLDPVHTFVLFSVQHLGIAHTYGRFNDVSGTVVFDKDNPSKSSVELSVPVESLDTHNSIRDKSLRSPDFFDAKQFPTMTFKSTKVEGSGEMLKVSGDLTIHGVTKPLSVDFKKGGEGKGVFGEMRGGGETHFTIKRSDFGMNFEQGEVGDEVNIILSLEGIKK